MTQQQHILNRINTNIYAYVKLSTTLAPKHQLKKLLDFRFQRSIFFDDTNLTMTTIDWSSIVFATDWEAPLRLRAKQLYGERDPFLIDEACNFVLEKLSENNWHKLSNFQGNSKPNTYVYKISGSLLIDFDRSKFGRQRPPKWLTQKGELWVKVWKLVCLKRYDPTMAINHFCHSDLRSPEYIKNIITGIKSKIPNCGKAHIKVQLDTLDISPNPLSPAHQAVDNTSHESNVNSNNYENIIDLFSFIIDHELDCKTPSQKSNEELASIVRQHLKLTPEELHILKLHYKEGLKTSVVSRVMGKTPYETRKLLKHLHSQLLTFLNEMGYTTENMSELVSSFDYE